MTRVLPVVAELQLVDHHCHGLVQAEVDRADFEEMLTEAATVSPLGTTLFDSLIGLAVRRWCAPVLDLPTLASAEDYLTRRAEIGTAQANRRFLAAAGIERFLVDSGLPTLGGRPLSTPDELGLSAGAPTQEIVRLEQIAEDVVRAGTTAAGFAAEFTALLRERSGHAVGVKSIAAYRIGLALSGTPPTGAEIRAAAGRWLSIVDRGAPIRLADEVLHRFLAWQAIELGLPLQFHVGYGDADLDLARADPLLLTEFLRATEHRGVPILLLHNYPFHRRAGYLAQVFEHVFIDIGLATHNLGRRSSELLAETLELAPFGKVLFATDACGLGELYYLGSLLFRRALSDFLHDGLDDGDWSAADAGRITRLLGRDNARRVYRLPTP